MKKTFLALVFLYWGLLFQVNGRGITFPSLPKDDSIPKIGPDQRLGFGEKKNTVWLNIGQLGFMESQISFERRTMPDVAVEGTIGIKPPRNLGQPYDLSVRSIGPQNYYDYIALIPYSAGIMANLSVKKYFRQKKEDWYLSGGFFYRYWLFNHQHLSSSEMDYQGSNNFSTKQSLRMHVSGFKLLAGLILGRFKLNEGTDLVVDLYTGWGYRKKLVSILNDPRVAVPDNTPAPAPELKRSENITFHFGLKVGLNF